MSKVRRRIQFSMSSLLLLLTVSCVGVGIYRIFIPPKIEVLVATDHLDIKTVISKTNAEFQSWPREIVPEGAITSSDGIPKGKVILTRLRKGQAIIGEDVVDPKTLISVNIPPGMKVVNVKLSICDSFGMLFPGDRVDVVVLDANGDWDFESEPIIENVRVFNVGSGTNSFGIVGLLVTEEQSAIIAFQRGVSQLDLRWNSGRWNSDLRWID